MCTTWSSNLKFVPFYVHSTCFYKHETEVPNIIIHKIDYKKDMSTLPSVNRVFICKMFRQIILIEILCMYLSILSGYSLIYSIVNVVLVRTL